MTSLVQNRLPLQLLSMSNHSEPRRKSKRLAEAAVYDEQDGDFLFTRGSKKQKTVKTPQEPPEEPEPAPAPKPRPIVIQKKPRGRPPSSAKKRASSPPTSPPPPKAQKVAPKEPPTTTSKRPTRRKASSVASSPVVPDEPLAIPKKRPSTRQTRSSIEQIAEENVDEEPPVKKSTARKANGTAAKDGRRAAPSAGSRKQQVQEQDNVQGTPMDTDKTTASANDDSQPQGQKIALPFSDTPINNRNKEFRKKGGAGGARRSSLGMRGRRASSLIENGHSAIPHREVEPAEFYKHIEAEGLSEPRRMKQLLTWCGERALSEKPPHGSSNSNAILGARAIQDQLLKDFGSKSEFSDWFSREDEPRAAAAKRLVVIKPNPSNIEHEQKITDLEARVKRLKEERKSWLALSKPLPEVPPLYPEGDPKKSPLPDDEFLDPEEAKMLESLTGQSSSFATMKTQARSRMQNVQSTLEFKVDVLADSIHKLDMRVVVAGRQADKVLTMSSARLKERDQKEKKAAGTKDLPVMEVLRSLGRILPEGGG